MSEGANTTIRVCVQCLGRLEAGSPHECQVSRGHALRAEDYPVLARIWDNPEDEAAYDVSPEAKAIILAPLERELAEERAARASLLETFDFMDAILDESDPMEVLSLRMLVHTARALAGTTTTPAEPDDERFESDIKDGW